MLRRFVFVLFALALVFPGSVAGQDATPPAGSSARGEFDGFVATADGRNLHVRCAGDGAPTIVFEQGGPSDTGASQLVGAPGLPTDLAGASRFCAYDRANLGQSDAAKGVRTITDLSLDLHAVLTAPEVGCPCVVIGESLGGAIAMAVAAQHPEDFAGMVLLDPPPSGVIDEVLKLAPVGSPEAAIEEPFDNPEMLDWAAVLRQEVVPGIPPGMPIAVLSHGTGYPPVCPCSDAFPKDELETWWQAGEAALAAALGGRLMVVDGSGHDIMSDRPDVVLAIVEDVLRGVREPGSWSMVATPEARPDATESALPAESEAMILPPDERVAGLSLAEWSARFWQWTLSFSSDGNPAADPTGERCGIGQSGPVFFLAWSGEQAELQCTVPAGVTLYVPLGIAECSTVEAAPWYGKDAEDLQACIKGNLDQLPAEILAQITLTVDGESLVDVSAYRAATEAFPVWLPSDNSLDAPQGVALAAADGFQALVGPLPVGQHEIVVSTLGSSDMIVVTYHIAVVDPMAGS